MVVQTNLQALNSNRMLGLDNAILAKHTEKLSSGYKINRAADDAAGLALSEKMRRQIRGLTQATNNAQDGVSFCQIADGALNEVHDMLNRSKELVIKAANGTNSEEDRGYIQAELTKLSQEIDRVHTTTVFNERSIFTDVGIVPDADATPSAKVEMPNGTVFQIEYGFVDSGGNPVTVSDSQATGTDNSAAKQNSAIAQFAIDAAANAVGKLSSAYSGLFTAASSSTIKIGLDLSNIDGTGNTLAVAKLRISSGSNNAMTTYTMQIDTSDYPIETFASASDADKADLAAVIAHEMTHLVMYDTLTDGMLSGRTTSFPKWFIEGVAQTSSGDNGWVSYRLNSSSDDNTIKNYMSQLDSMPYGAGYLASMYLGYAVAKNGNASAAVNSATIKGGLDKLMKDMVGGAKTLNQAIADNTGYSGLSAFQQAFKSGSSEALTFVKDLLTARGTSGAGSLLGNLSDSESSLFGTLGSGNGNYLIQKNNTAYSNAFGTGYTFPEKGSIDGGDAGFWLQIGAEAGQHLDVLQFNVSADALLGDKKFDVTSGEDAIGTTLDAINEAARRVSYVRSYYGAIQNRLEHTINNLNNVVENTTSAESLIRDTDMATEMVAYSNHQILQQAATSILSQANQSQRGVLSLLS